MKSSVRLEQESEQVRTRVAETLDELRFRATPGQLVDQLLDYARDGNGAAYFRNLRREVVDHPLPVTLIGAGLAWMMVQSLVANRGDGAPMSRYGVGGDGTRAGDAVRDLGERASAAGRNVSDAASSTARDWSARGRSAMDSAGEKLRDASASAGETVRGVRDGVRDASDSAGERLRDASASAAERLRNATARAGAAISQAKESATSTLQSLRDRTSSAYESATTTIRDSSNAVVQGGQSAIEFSKEQPLVLGGLGFALGAALGALLPPTETEDRWMGETSDEAKESARRLAEKAKESSKAVYEDVKASVQDAGAQSATSSAGAQSGIPTGAPGGSGSSSASGLSDRSRLSSGMAYGGSQSASGGSQSGGSRSGRSESGGMSPHSGSSDMTPPGATGMHHGAPDAIQQRGSLHTGTVGATQQTGTGGATQQTATGGATQQTATGGEHHGGKQAAEASMTNKPMEESAGVQQGGKPIAGDRSASERGRQSPATASNDANRKL
jgi:uncharacterized protein DUF3618